MVKARSKEELEGEKGVKMPLEAKKTLTALKKVKKELNWELSMLILKLAANNDGGTLERVKKRSKG